MRICIFTGSRSEYSLLKKLIILLNKDPFFQCKLVVSGSHLSNLYGLSYKEILDDGIKIFSKQKVNLKDSSPWSVCNAFALVNQKLNIFFQKNKFDLLIVLGDRYEALAVSIAAYINRIKICHIHGGEKTLDSLDDNFRHAISKFSNYHFVSHKLNKKRLIQLGENKENIHVVGGLGANIIKNFQFHTKNFLEKELKLTFHKKTILVNFYPEISNNFDTKKNLKFILNTINFFPKFQFVFTLPSHDRDVDFFEKKISNLCKKRKNCFVFKNLGQRKYLSLMKYSDLVIGNSSSGILEAPSFSRFSLNIGNRQSGRIFSKSVIQTSAKTEELKKKIKKYINKKSNFKNEYYRNNTYDLMVQKLKKIKKNLNKNFKEFVDI